MSDIIPQDTFIRNKPFALTPSQREEICQRYVAGESTVVLAKTFGVTKANVRQMLITRNIPRRENTPELHRIYQCNHAYFDEPLDEERAYWIGFLLADGCVTFRRAATASGAPVLCVTLSEVDIAHIEKFRDALQSDHPISRRVAKSGYGAGKTSARLAITSQQLVNAVGQFGVVEQKTKLCATPHLPPELMRHMYRGYVDGDGGLSLYQKNGGYLEAGIDIVGTKIFLSDMAAWMSNYAEANSKTPLKSKNTDIIMVLKYGGIHQVSNILHALYDGATIYLERKLRMAQDIWYATEEQQSYRRNDFI